MDDYIRELMEDRGQAVWVAELASGERVYMDDGRPGFQPRSAWLRLKARGERIHRLGLCFRSRLLMDILPADAAGYFFSHSSVAILNQEATLSFFLLGVLTDHQILIQRWKVPELLLMDSFVRDESETGEAIIRF